MRELINKKRKKKKNRETKREKSVHERECVRNLLSCNRESTCHRGE